MVFKLRYVLIGALSLLGAWISWNVYDYFFDTTMPRIELVGIEPEGSYCADVQCHISSNKAGECAIYLDGQLLANPVKLSSRDFEYSSSIPVSSLTNGTHSIRVVMTDRTFKKNKAILSREFTVDTVPLEISFVEMEPDYRVLQGRTLHIQFQSNKEIKSAYVNALANKYTCSPKTKNSFMYECFIPIACEEAPNEYYFTLEVADRVGNLVQLDNKFHIISYPFKKQSVTIEAEKVKQEKELGLPMNNLETMLQELARKSPQEKLWKGEFCTPIDIVKTTCEFGTIRTTQEKGRYMHKAVDVVNLPKSVVWATQDGIVVVKERYDASGNTVVIDHGLGIFSLFYHLDEFADINVGQKICKGNPIGTLGKTGYAQGYHLHWEMRVNNVAIDPMQWTTTTF
jgi:hypothetical protein